ncbi:MAG: hypothetical protein QOH68_3018 [Nocardioidaceae bacterium]|nr:hypothetical protein [Nocardioidaceae bacterium]
MSDPTPTQTVPPPPKPGTQPLLLRGFAPLVVALVLAALMVLLVPSIAPERVVIRPGAPQTATTVAPPATTAVPTTAVPTTAVPTTVVVAP